MGETLDSFRGFFSPAKNQHSFDPIYVAKRTFEIVRKRFKLENVEMEFPKDFNPVTVEGVQNEFAQVALALFVNSLEAINNRREEGGLNVMEHKGVVAMSASADSEWLQIKVSDNGSGIKGEILRKIFESRFTTKKSSGGSGVGLFVAKAIIENKMRGFISAFSDENGASFEIKLPVSKEPISRNTAM